jgi:iron complex transport system ATP-binding protein
MKHVIEAEGLSYSYTPEVAVLQEISATLHSGVVTGVIGPNGAGKSTLLQLLCGLLSPDVGQITMDGKCLSSLGDRERARLVAYMPQSVNPAFSLSVFEVVALGRYPHLGPFGVLGEPDREIVHRCLSQTETEALATRDFLSLSGGERQRVVLASVLAQEPRILLLDEPTSALDLPHEVAFFRRLRELAAAGLGVVVITHDINMAAQFCDHLLLLGESHTLICQGAPADVLTETFLQQAYGSVLSVGQNPDTGSPFVTVPVGTGP